MESSERVRKGRRNYTAALLASAVSGAAMFFERIVFLSRLSVSYLGFSSLFENLFLFLSVLDAGIGTSLTSFIVDAAAEGEGEKAVSGARTIGTAVSLSILLSSLPLALLVLRERGAGGENMVPFFLLYIAVQCCQYLFGWRSVALMAMGEGHIVSFFVHSGRTAQSVAGIIVLLSGGGYTAYFTISIVFVFLSFLLLHIYTGTVLPWTRCGRKWTGIRKLGRMGRNMGAMVMHKCSFVFLRSFEIVAAYVIFGAERGGIYSNYLFLSNIFMTLFWILRDSVTGVVSDALKEKDEDEKHIFLKRVFLSNLLLSFVFGLFFALCGTYFTALFFGSENLLGPLVPVFMGMLLTASSVRTSFLVYRDAGGLFQSDRFKVAGEVVISIALTYVLSVRLSMGGIPLSLFLTLAFFSIPVEAGALWGEGKGRTGFRLLSSFLTILSGALIWLISRTV